MNSTVSGNPVLPLIGRILIAALFLVAGVGKIMGFAGTAGYMAKLGFPAPEVMTAISILFEAGGGILLIIGWKTRWVAWGLAIFVVIATLAAHRFWEIPDAAQMMSQRIHFLKNLAIIGGLLFVAAFGPGSISVDKR
jgi:putative oxidoreductase